MVSPQDAVKTLPAHLSRTRYSLYYLAGYLIPTGLLWLIAPVWSFKLLFSNGQYDPIFPRVSGLLLFGIGLLVIQMIRHRLYVLYPTTLLVRSVFICGFVSFYVMTRDPLFLMVLGVLGFGFLLTGFCYLLDRRALRSGIDTASTPSPQ